MSDILDDLDTEFAGSLDVCQKPLGDGICAIPLPVGHHPSRKYCDDHQPAASKPKKQAIAIALSKAGKSRKKRKSK